MDRHDVDWRGYFAALPTPFTAAGDLDLDAFAATIDVFVEQGVHGLLVNGSTGEWATQTETERRLVAERATAATAGRVPLIVAVTHPELAVSVALAKHAEGVGADAVMIPPPPGVRPTQSELRGYFVDVACATTLPCWLYNFPQENNTSLGLELIRDLVDIDNVVAIKQSTPDDRELYATIQAVGDRMVVFGNLLTRLGMAAINGGLGGDGHFGSGMPLGARMPAFFEHVWRGELEQAGEIADQFAALMGRLRGTDTDGYNWRYGGMQSSLKTLMNLLGQPGGHPRRPKLPITDPAIIAEFSTALREAGLPVAVQGATE
jgi:dihydrodipicolinate synthase/N-acetylneuraminate lyase